LHEKREAELFTSIGIAEVRGILVPKGLRFKKRSRPELSEKGGKKKEEWVGLRELTSKTQNREKV